MTPKTKQSEEKEADQRLSTGAKPSMTDPKSDGPSGPPRPARVSKGNPVSRSFHSSAPVMRLPSGHKTDHWSWSLSETALRIGAPQSSHEVQVGDDDLFLFPMGSGSLQTPSPFTALPSSYFKANDAQPSRDDQSPAGAEEMSEPPVASRPANRPPLALRTRSFTPSARHVKTSPNQRPVKRSHSITVASLKSARRRHYTSMHSTNKEANLQRQVADLTQRVSMLLANQCAACRLGLIQCGLRKEGDAEESRDDESLQSEIDDEDMAEEVAENPTSGINISSRDHEREDQIEGQLQRLARQARMVAYG